MFLAVLLMTNGASADPLVILNNPESNTGEIQEKVKDGAEFLTWDELREFPLAFGSVEASKTCLGKPVSLDELRDALKSAESSVAYLETKSALGHVRKIQSNLVCVNEPIPTALLARSSYIAGVAYNYDENLELAKTNWQQALMYDPSMVWDENIEPSGRPAFEEALRIITNQASTRLIFMPDEATLTIDGHTPKSGDSVIAGEHLVQHNALGFQGHTIKTEMGTDAYIVSFADFPSDLGVVMADPVKRNEMLKALLMVQDKTDIRVVTNSEYWYLPMGTTKWKSQELKNASNSGKKSAEIGVAATDGAERAHVKSKDAGRINKPVFYAGAGTLALGAASLIIANQHHQTFEGYGVGTSATEVEETWGLQRGFWFAGTGLAVVGGGLMIGGTF